MNGRVQDSNAQIDVRSGEGSRCNGCKELLELGKRMKETEKDVYDMLERHHGKDQAKHGPAPRSDLKNEWTPRSH